MNIRLFIFDWDGTALGGHEPYDRFPPGFVCFLDGLQKRGIRWVTNTTWSLENQFKVIRESGVKSSPVFLAGSSGRILGAVTGNKLKIDPAYMRRICMLDRRFFTRFGPLMRRIAARLLREELADQVYFNPYGHHYMSFHFRNAGLARRGWKIAAPLLKPGIMYRAFRPGDSVSDDSLMPFYMNKGAVIDYLRRRLGLRPEEILVAGDGFNDLHMFDPRRAKWMVCPANAHPLVKNQVRKHGGLVSKLNYSHGVVEAATRILSAI